MLDRQIKEGLWGGCMAFSRCGRVHQGLLKDQLGLDGVMQARIGLLSASLALSV